MYMLFIILGIGEGSWNGLTLTRLSYGTNIFFWHQFLWGELRPYKAHISLKSSELLRLTFIGKSWNHTSSLDQMVNTIIHAANLSEALFARCHSCQCEYFSGQTDRSLSLGSARVPKGTAMSVLLTLQLDDWEKLVWDTSGQGRPLCHISEGLPR